MHWWPICAVIIQKRAVMNWILCSDEFFHCSVGKIWILTFSEKTNERSLPFPMKVCLTPPSTVAGNFTHFIKLKSPLYSFFQQNFGNNISTIQTSLRRKVRLLSNQSFEEKWTWNKYTEIGSKEENHILWNSWVQNCLGIRRNKYIHSVQSTGHTYKKFPREHAPEPP